MKNQNFHFMVTNVYNWRCTSDEENLAEVIEVFQNYGIRGGKKGMKAPAFDVWYIPQPSGTAYSIEDYTPQVKGAVHLGRFDK